MTPDILFDLKTQHNARYQQPEHQTLNGRITEGSTRQGNMVSRVGESFTNLVSRFTVLMQRMQTRSKSPVINFYEGPAGNS
ncbi:MAG: hypothetical protein AAF702_47675 [Chloroflexota bacterium]